MRRPSRGSYSSRPRRRAAAPAAGAFREAAGAAGGEDYGWRPLSATERDLSPVDQGRMQQLAHHAWEQHRVANRLVELPIAFLLAEDVTVEVEDEEAQAWLDRWWRDPITRMDLNLEKRMRELSLFGEQVVCLFTAPNGHVRHGALDPAYIIDVIMDPDNAALPIGVEMGGFGDDGRTRTLRIVLDGADDELLAPPAIALRQAMDGGECHYWRINDLLTGRRGRSDLLSAIDLADAYSQLIFGEVERAAILRMAVWDVTLKGATEDQVRARAGAIHPPRSGSIRVHNDSEEWAIVTPTLGAADAAQTLRTVRNEVLGGGTIPEHWFGGGGDVNRATAGEMDEPTYKVFRRRQRLWQAMLEAEARHVIRSRLRALGRDMGDAELPEMQPCARFAEMQTVDLSRVAQALAQIVAAGASAIERGLMTAETAVGLIARVATRLGAEIDPSEELERVRAAQAQQQEADAFPGAAPDLTDDAEMPAAPGASPDPAADGGAT